MHYAAIYGSISCLKVFKKCKVDLMVTDQNGATPAHHAAAGGHLECLKCLTKLGIALDKKDMNSKTSAHYVRFQINKFIVVYHAPLGWWLMRKKTELRDGVSFSCLL